MSAATTTPASQADTTTRVSLAGFDVLLGTPVSMRSLALLRVLIGPVVLLHLRPILDAARSTAISARSQMPSPETSNGPPYQRPT